MNPASPLRPHPKDATTCGIVSAICPNRLAALSACIALVLFFLPAANARHKIFSPVVKTLRVTVNQDWLSPPVMVLGQGDVLNVSFDHLSHQYHRFVYHIDHCEADWTISEAVFENDFLSGFNDNPIEDYQNSVNTTVDYTHYRFRLPNDRCQLKLSGNYRLTVYDADNENEKVLEAEFMIAEQSMNVGLEVTANTDIGLNKSYQQVSMSVGYNKWNVTNIDEQISTVVMQNGCEASAKRNVRPNLINNRGLVWEHNRQLIFEAGNEYRKYEVLATSHPTMGIEHINWDGHHYHAYPYIAEPRPNYLTDEDADGAFYIRNSDNTENDYTTDYVFVHYKLKSPEITNGRIIINGNWTTDANRRTYTMEYDSSDGTYNATVMQKMGYYNYQYLVEHPDGSLSIPPTEGSYYQTENRYQALVYYKGTTDRTWRITGYRQLIFK